MTRGLPKEVVQICVCVHIKELGKVAVLNRDFNPLKKLETRACQFVEPFEVHKVEYMTFYNSKSIG